MVVFQVVRILQMSSYIKKGCQTKHKVHATVRTSAFIIFCIVSLRSVSLVLLFLELFIAFVGYVCSVSM